MISELISQLLIFFCITVEHLERISICTHSSTRFISDLYEGMLKVIFGPLYKKHFCIKGFIVHELSEPMQRFLTILAGIFPGFLHSLILLRYLSSSIPNLYMELCRKCGGRFFYYNCVRLYCSCELEPMQSRWRLF